MLRNLKFISLALACLAFLPVGAHAQSAQTIYKHVDDGGRVTYSNSRIKGAERVDLQPITVLPSAKPRAPGGNITVARVTSTPQAEKAVTVAALNVTPQIATKSIEAPKLASDAMAEVPAVPNASVAALATPVSAQNAPMNALPVPSAPRHDEIQRRSVLNSLLAEQESLANSKARLAEESKNSESIRALRASFVAAPDKSGIKKIVTPEMREQVEHHFARIRDLQDEIAMHEQNVASLRTQLRALPAAGVLAAQ